MIDGAGQARYLVRPWCPASGDRRLGNPGARPAAYPSCVRACKICGPPRWRGRDAEREAHQGRLVQNCNEIGEVPERPKGLPC